MNDHLHMHIYNILCLIDDVLIFTFSVCGRCRLVTNLFGRLPYVSTRKKKRTWRTRFGLAFTVLQRDTFRGVLTQMFHAPPPIKISSVIVNTGFERGASPGSHSEIPRHGWSLLHCG